MPHTEPVASSPVILPPDDPLPPDPPPPDPPPPDPPPPDPLPHDPLPPDPPATGAAASVAPIAVGSAVSLGASALRTLSAGALKDGLLTAGRYVLGNAGWVGAAASAAVAGLVYMGAARKLDDAAGDEPPPRPAPPGTPGDPGPHGDLAGPAGAALAAHAFTRTDATRTPRVAMPLDSQGKPLQRSPFLPRDGELDPADTSRLLMPGTPADLPRAAGPSDDSRKPAASAGGTDAKATKATEETEASTDRPADDPPHDARGPHAPGAFPESRMVPGAHRPWIGHLLVKMPQPAGASAAPRAVPLANTQLVVAHGEAINRTVQLPKGTAVTVVALGNGLSDDVARSLMHGDYTGFARPGDPLADPAAYNALVRLVGSHPSLDGITTWLAGATIADLRLASAHDMEVGVEAYTPPQDDEVNLSELLAENAGHIVLITCTAGLRPSTQQAFGPLAHLEDPGHAMLEQRLGQPIANLEREADLPGLFRRDPATGRWTREVGLMRQSYRESLHLLEPGSPVWYPDLLVHDPRVDPPLAASAYTVAPEDYDFNAYKLPQDVRERSHLAAREGSPDYWQVYDEELASLPEAQRQAMDDALQAELDRIRALDDADANADANADAGDPPPDAGSEP